MRVISGVFGLTYLMIAAESILVKTFSFIESRSTAVITVRFLIETTNATSFIMKSDCFAPFSAALSAIAFIRARSSAVSLILRDSNRCIACALNLSGVPAVVPAAAFRSTSLNFGVPAGGI